MGPAPGDQGGVPYMTGQLLGGLASAGIEVDCFLTASLPSVPMRLRDVDSLRFICHPSPWRYDRWYSRTDTAKFVTGLTARAVAQFALGVAVRHAHAERRYDLVYQFSHSELTALRPHLRYLPPVVLHPEVHARGELVWHRRERHLALRGGTFGRYALAHSALAARTHIQRRDMKLAATIIVPSRRFASLLVHDYGLDPGRMRVVPNPIDLERFRPSRVPRRHGPVRLLFVSRISVRKGVEMIVGLSHRLADLAGRVTIEVIGDHALWSDYRVLLEDLYRPVASFRGPLPGRELPAEYMTADGLLQPSHYEPFALTVGEALAAGVPVITSDEVGASEDVNPQCSHRFRAGNLDSLESAARRLIERVENGERPGMATMASSEATRLFGIRVVAPQLAEALESALP